MDLQRVTATVRRNENKLSAVRNKRRRLDLFEKFSRGGYPRQGGLQYLFDCASMSFRIKLLELKQCCLHALRREIITHGHQSAGDSLCLIPLAFLTPVQQQHNDDRQQRHAYDSSNRAPPHCSPPLALPQTIKGDLQQPGD